MQTTRAIAPISASHWLRSNSSGCEKQSFIHISYWRCSEQKDDPDEVNLKAEMQQYGDIVRIDMVDTYADLSMKTLRMFSILPQKIDADFYFKIDDDVAVNVDALADYLEAHRTQGNLYMVSFAHRLPVACAKL